MTPEQETVLLIKGVIADLPLGLKASVDDAVAKIRALLAEDEDATRMAIALIGAELHCDA